MKVTEPTDGKAEAQGTTALVLTWKEPTKVEGSPGAALPD